MASSIAALGGLSTDDVIDALSETRARTLALVDGISDEDLERVHSTLMSPLVWDLGHIAAFEDLWLVHRFGGRDLLREDLADVYDAFETPRAGRGELPFLRPAAARDYLAEVRHRTLSVIEERGIEDGTLAELVIRHEQQHNETMLQTMQLAHLDPIGEIVARQAPVARIPHLTGLEFVVGARRRVHDRRVAGRVRVRQRTTPPPHRCPRVPDRADADHQCHVPHVCRGRRLRAPRVVVRRGVGVEGGVRHHETSRVDGGPPLGVAARKTRAAPPPSSRRPRFLVRGRCLRPRPRRPPADGVRVGKGSDLGSRGARVTAVSVG